MELSNLQGEPVSVTNSSTKSTDYSGQPAAPFPLPSLDYSNTTNSTQIRIGQTRWVVRAMDITTNVESWRLEWREVTPIINLGQTKGPHGQQSSDQSDKRTVAFAQTHLSDRRSAVMIVEQPFPGALTTELLTPDRPRRAVSPEGSVAVRVNGKGSDVALLIDQQRVVISTLPGQHEIEGVSIDKVFQFHFPSNVMGVYSVEPQHPEGSGFLTLALLMSATKGEVPISPDALYDDSRWKPYFASRSSSSSSVALPSNTPVPIRRTKSRLIMNSLSWLNPRFWRPLRDPPISLQQPSSNSDICPVETIAALLGSECPPRLLPHKSSTLQNTQEVEESEICPASLSFSRTFLSLVRYPLLDREFVLLFVFSLVLFFQWRSSSVHGIRHSLLRQISSSELFRTRRQLSCPSDVFLSGVISDDESDMSRRRLLRYAQSGGAYSDDDDWSEEEKKKSKLYRPCSYGDFSKLDTGDEKSISGQSRRRASLISRTRRSMSRGRRRKDRMHSISRRIDITRIHRSAEESGRSPNALSGSCPAIENCSEDQARSILLQLTRSSKEGRDRILSTLQNHDQLLSDLLPIQTTSPRRPRSDSLTLRQFSSSKLSDPLAIDRHDMDVPFALRPRHQSDSAAFDSQTASSSKDSTSMEQDRFFDPEECSRIPTESVQHSSRGRSTSTHPGSFVKRLPNNRGSSDSGTPRVMLMNGRSLSPGADVQCFEFEETNRQKRRRFDDENYPKRTHNNNTITSYDSPLRVFTSDGIENNSPTISITLPVHEVGYPTDGGWGFDGWMDGPPTADHTNNVEDLSLPLPLIRLNHHCGFRSIGDSMRESTNLEMKSRNESVTLPPREPQSVGGPPQSKIPKESVLAQFVDNGRFYRTFEAIEMIGKGGFGSVYKVRHRFEPDFPEYAVKFVTLRLKASENIAKRRFLREISANRDLFSRHIVRYFTWWCEEPQYLPQSAVDCVPEVPTLDDDSEVIDGDSINEIKKRRRRRLRASPSVVDVIRVKMKRTRTKTVSRPSDQLNSHKKGKEKSIRLGRQHVDQRSQQSSIGKETEWAPFSDSSSSSSQDSSKGLSSRDFSMDVVRSDRRRSSSLEDRSKEDRSKEYTSHRVLQQANRHDNNIVAEEEDDFIVFEDSDGNSKYALISLFLYF